MTDTEKKDPPPAAPPKKDCALCVPKEELPIADRSDPDASLFALGYATGVNGAIPDVCDRHHALLGATVQYLAARLNPGALRSAQVMAAVVHATGLSRNELVDTIKRHQAEGLGPAESFAYLQKVAAARGNVLVARDGQLEALGQAVISIPLRTTGAPS